MGDVLLLFGCSFEIGGFPFPRLCSLVDNFRCDSFLSVCHCVGSFLVGWLIARGIPPSHPHTLTHLIGLSSGKVKIISGGRLGEFWDVCGLPIQQGRKQGNAPTATPPRLKARKEDRQGRGIG